MTTKTEEIATVPKGLEGIVTLDRPEGKDEGLLGNEGIGRSDVLIPRLGIAQKMSPEIDHTQARYIEGLQFTDFFHSLEKRNLGKGPLHFVILRRDDPRWVEFRPIKDGGGIIDPSVPPGDPRLRFGPNGEKPVATMFLDYLVLMLTGFDASDPLKSIVGLSLKSSGIKAAKYLNFLVTTRGQKLICKGVYSVTSGSDTDKKSGGVYAVYKFKNAGWLTPGSAIEKLALEMHEAWMDRAVVIDADDTPDDEVPFDVPAGGSGGDPQM